MRDYITMVEEKDVDKLCQYATENGIAFDIFEGSLQDNYIFYDTSSVPLTFDNGKRKCRNNIIVREKYLNAWSSGLEMIMTNNNELVEQYRQSFEGDGWEQ